MSTYNRLHLGLLRLHPGPFQLIEYQTDVQRCRFDICIKLTAPPVQSRHKCTGDIELGLMPVVTTMPWSAAPSLCIPPSASAPHQQVAQHTSCGAGVESVFSRWPLPPSSTTTPARKAWKASSPQTQSFVRPLTQPPLDFLEATSSKVGSSSPGWIPTIQKLP